MDTSESEKPYTVQELIDLLKTFNPKALVYLASDEEGNAVLPFQSYGADNQDPSAYSDYDELSQEELLAIIKDESPPPDASKATHIILYPAHV